MSDKPINLDYARRSRGPRPSKGTICATSSWREYWRNDEPERRQRRQVREVAQRRGLVKPLLRSRALVGMGARRGTSNDRWRRGVEGWKGRGWRVYWRVFLDEPPHDLDQDRNHGKRSQSHVMTAAAYSAHGKRISPAASDCATKLSRTDSSFADSQLSSVDVQDARKHVRNEINVIHLGKLNPLARSSESHTLRWGNAIVRQTARICARTVFTIQPQIPICSTLTPSPCPQSDTQLLLGVADMS